MPIMKLIPALKDYLWGGDYLKKYRQSNLDKIAESWELSMHKDGLSKVNINGEIKNLKDVITNMDLGKNLEKFSDFPVLIKLIDAKDNLSVQVHPSDEYALKYEGQYGKTEMWYVIDAKEDAGLYVGFKEDENVDKVRKYLKEGTILDHLNFFKVKKGDVFFIKSGTIHAIGKGVTLIEIQQNSNLTYRLYDYNRKDKNGNLRPLHIDKALNVIDYHKYKQVNHEKNFLGISKYFASYQKNAIIDKEIFEPDSFVSITFLDGKGTINGITYQKFDSFFISAGEKCFIEGVGTYILTKVLKMEKYVIGVDIGGTTFKIGIVNEFGQVLAKTTYPVDFNQTQVEMIETLGRKILKLMEENNVSKENTLGIGVGCPGSINSIEGTCDFSGNLRWNRLPVAKILERVCGLETKISNDANVATLGEVKFGCGKGYKDVIMITLGTGVGGGIIINGKLYEGNEGKGAEIGHSVIHMNGRKCTCGRKGCLEAYTSASALVNDAKKVMRKYKDSIMWKKCQDNIDNLNGKIIFDSAKEGDAAANKVLDQYFVYLKEVVLNFCNIFRPELIIIGGGLSGQKDYLLNRLVPLLEEENYGFFNTPKVEIKCAELGNDAGIIGAASLID